MTEADQVPVHGECAPGFEPVRQAFRECWTDHGELGASCHVLVGNEVVVDLWGGWVDESGSSEWQADTLVNAYSVGKAVVATLLLRVLERRGMGLETPIADVWPEFGAGGKYAATIRQALCHQAGVPAIRERLTDRDLTDFDGMCAALAATEPWWEPGERHSYHTNTYGHLVGGLIRAIDGRLPGEVLREVAEPLGADVHFGVADADLDRCAEVIWGLAPHPPLDPWDPGLDEEQRMTLLSYANPPGYSSMGVVNEQWWRQAQVPSTNGHMTARGVSRFYRALLDHELLGPELLEEATRPQSHGWCPILDQDVTFGLGFQPWTPERQLGRSPGGYGHFGTGGALGFADPARGVAFGYVMNHVIPRWQSPRNRALVDAVYACLGAGHQTG